jgi:phage terminase large subunit-like protein
VFDEQRADRAQGFFQKILSHTKGQWARRPFILTPWQRDIIRPLFGTVMQDDQLDALVRQYRLAWIEVGRKNGKSEMLSGIALMMLCADDEESAEVYGAASDRDQASLVYNVSKRMVELSPILSKRLTVIDSKKRIIDSRTNSYYQVIAADAGGNLGQNPHGVIFDEVLTQPNRELWDALKTGMGTRAQPLMVAATTAGTTSAQFCLEEHDYTERVLAARERGEELDPSRFGFVRNTPRDADWEDEANWYHANPALGDFLNINTLRSEAREAALKPQAQNAFRQYRLNQWVSQSSRWLDMRLWSANNLGALGNMTGRKCYGGLDLSSTSDFTAWVLVFPRDDGGLDVLPRIWVPRGVMEQRHHRMHSQFEVWERTGVITVTQGDTIDYDAIEKQIAADATQFVIGGVGYDPWNASSVVAHVEDGGLACVKIPQTAQRLNGPSKEIERLLGRHSLNHAGHPALAWMADNVQVLQDAEGNIKPSKKKSADRIDGIAALVNAVFVALMAPAQAAPPAFYSLADYA